MILPTKIVWLSCDFKVYFRFIFSPDYIFLGKVDAFPPALTSHISLFPFPFIGCLP